ncbi:MAG: type II toxin-antitoxin system VapC family toxin [Terriglobia bacterium]|jgi:predicted nucleic acid-binding protein
MTILLDTSVMIDTLRRRRGRQELLESLLREGHDLACCAINIAEVYSGMRPEEVRATAEFFDNLKYVEIDRGTARNAGELRAKWRRRGKTLSLPDAMIAAVALSLNLPLATDYAKDFPMPELRFLAVPRD